jgi:hypothetical protein
LGHSDNYGVIVDVVVGGGWSKQTFQIYEGLLKHYSSYFKTALKEEWAGEGCRALELPHDDPDVFRAFFNWICNGKLFQQLTKEGGIPFSYQKICQIYVLGDMRGVPELCNASLDLLYQKTTQLWQFPNTSVHSVYELTRDNDSLRRMFVDDAVDCFTFVDMKTKKDNYPKDFLIDVLETSCMRNVVPGENMTGGKSKSIHMRKLEICAKYHDHSSPRLQDALQFR